MPHHASLPRFCRSLSLSLSLSHARAPLSAYMYTHTHTHTHTHQHTHTHTGEMLYDMDFIALDNTHLEQSPLLSTLRVGFEPCCIPLSVERARGLVEWTIKEDDGLVNIQIHAQNFHSSVVSDREYLRRIQEVVELVLHLRRGYPRMVFVTVSELLQLKAKGWSREVCVCIHQRVCMYMYTERERVAAVESQEWSREVCAYICIHTCAYVYVYRERESWLREVCVFVYIDTHIQS
jgi:hypothetical protein